MPSVLVVPVYVEVPQGVERAIHALESYLRQAGYAFYTGEPVAEELEQTKARLDDALVHRNHDEYSGGTAISA